jgi:predicted amidophosphoribosyltransferase
MPFPKKICVVCGEEFELKPDKPGFANRCPECSVPEETKASANDELDPVERRTVAEMNAARRKAIRDLLYRGDA